MRKAHRLKEEFFEEILGVERERMAQELHDGIAQTLYLLLLNLQVCEKFLKLDPNLVSEKLKVSQELVRKSLKEIRQAILKLKSDGLERESPPKQIEKLLKGFKEVNGLSLRWEINGLPRNLPPEIIDNLSFFIQEGLSNILKHSRASEAQVKLRFQKEKTTLTLKDNGCGFGAEKVLSKTNGEEKLGLRGLRERTQNLGGAFKIESRPGSGTELEITLPH